MIYTNNQRETANLTIFVWPAEVEKFSFFFPLFVSPLHILQIPPLTADRVTVQISEMPSVLKTCLCGSCPNGGPDSFPLTFTVSLILMSCREAEFEQVLSGVHLALLNFPYDSLSTFVTAGHIHSKFRMASRFSLKTQFQTKGEI